MLYTRLEVKFSVFTMQKTKWHEVLQTNRERNCRNSGYPRKKKVDSKVMVGKKKWVEIYSDAKHTSMA